MPNVGFGGTTYSTSWSAWNGVSTSISVSPRRIAANGKGPQLVTAIGLYNAGRSASRTCQLFFGGTTSGTITRASASNGNVFTGYIGIASTYIANGTTVTVGHKNASGGIYFAHASSGGTTTDTNGYTWTGSYGGAYSYVESPTQPASLTATPSTTVTGQVNLSWGAPTDNGGTAVTSYNIYTKSGSAYTLKGTTTSAQTTSRTFSVTGLTANTSYTFVVRARNAVTDAASTQSVDSPTATATAPYIPPPVYAPDAPGSFTAVTSTTSLGQVNLSWSTPVNNGGSAINDYKIYVNGSYFASKGGTGTTYTVTGLNQRQSYSFYVTAMNSGGYESPASSTATTAASGVPTAPATITSVVDYFTSGVAHISWTPPENSAGTLQGYRVYNAATDTLLTGGDVDDTVTTFTVTGLTQGWTYSYYVKAYNTFGVSPKTDYSAASDTTSVTAISVTGAPSVISSATVPGRVIIEFNETPGAASYTITNKVTNATVTLPGNAAIAGKVVYVWDGLTPGTAYTFTKQAAGGQVSEQSVSVTPGATATQVITTADAVVNETNTLLNGTYQIKSQTTDTVTYQKTMANLDETTVTTSSLSTVTDNTNVAISKTNVQIDDATANTFEYSATTNDIETTAVSRATVTNNTNTRLNGTVTVATVAPIVVGGDDVILTYEKSTAGITAISPAKTSGGTVENITQASFNTDGTYVTITDVTETTVSYSRTAETATVDEVPATGRIIDKSNALVFNSTSGNDQIDAVPAFNKISIDVGTGLTAATSGALVTVAYPLDSVAQVTKTGDIEVLYRPGSLG